MAKTILLLGGLLNQEKDELSQHFEVIAPDRQYDFDAVLQAHRNDIVGIVSAPWTKVSGHLIEGLPNLEIISQSGIGVDNIDLSIAERNNIVVTNTPDLVTNDTADVAMMLMLGVARRAFEGDMYVRVGKWPSGNMGLGTSLTGKTLGILGMGRIGSAIAHRASAFDMNVIYNSRTEKPDLPYRFYPQLIDMAQECDFLLCACPGGKETENIVDLHVLDALGEQGFLINIARGSVVDEEALLISLRNKKIAGAALDVYNNEPFVPDALFKMDNVVLLPHIGTATNETRSMMGRLVIENLVAHFNGEPLKISRSGVIY